LKNFSIISFLFLPFFLFAQSEHKIDSLKTLIEQEKDITQKTGYLYDLGDLFETSNPDSAIHYYQIARDFAKENDFALGEARYASYVNMILNKQGKFSEALSLTQKALEKYKKINNPNNLAIAYLNMGKQYRYFSDFESCIDYYLEAKKIADSIQDKSIQRTINNNLCAIFLDLNQPDKATVYGLASLKLAEKSGDKANMLSPLYNLANAATQLEKDDEAMVFLDRFEKIAIELESHYDIIDAYLAKGSAIGKTNLEKGIQYMNLAIAESKKYQFLDNEYYAYLYLAEIQLWHKKYKDALQNIQKGIPIAAQLEAKYDLADFHKKASEAYEHLGNFEEALKHNRKYDKLISEIQLEENKNRLLGLEAKYQSEKQEAEIKILNAQSEAQALSIKQKNTLNYIFFGAILLIGIISILSYLNYKNRQKISLQRIQELETEKQLSATQALLQGQEDERSRMAKELHDGLGGLLSGVKLNLHNMNKKLIITEEDGNSFEKSITLLDESISELRRVAHNLMPESILKFGLDGAIREFLQSVDNENLKINYQSYHIENGINKQLDISTYRIIQELVNNAMKHADASEILVQVRKDEHFLVIDVEDNGKGFDPDSIKKESGMGLTGIRSRINYWKGDLQIESAESSGTSVHIEIPV